MTGQYAKEKHQGVKKSHSPQGVPNRHQDCKSVQRNDQHFLHMGLLSHNNKPHMIDRQSCTSVNYVIQAMLAMSTTIY